MPLFRSAVTCSDESGWDHMAGECPSPSVLHWRKLVTSSCPSVFECILFFQEVFVFRWIQLQPFSVFTTGISYVTTTKQAFHIQNGFPCQLITCSLLEHSVVCTAVCCAALDLQWHDRCARTVTGQAGSATRRSPLGCCSSASTGWGTWRYNPL